MIIHCGSTRSDDSVQNEEENDSDTAFVVPSRRQWLKLTTVSTIASTVVTAYSNPILPALAASEDSESHSATKYPPFRTKAFNLKEYTNSIVASRDTNVSPKEAYDVLADAIAPLANNNKKKKTLQSANSNDHIEDNTNNNWALDVGAGAGVSTQTLYDMGLTHLDAVDWSGTAWDENVVSCPPTVTFHEMDDERFFANQRKQNPNRKYEVIVYNFAINLDKAVRVAKEYLDPELDSARLLAPANVQKDYWYKQTYYLINQKGEIKWNSNPDVGGRSCLLHLAWCLLLTNNSKLTLRYTILVHASNKIHSFVAWSVQFQPDVTEDTCQGIWCPPYNGFVKKR